MEEEFLSEFHSLIANMLEHLTPRYTPLSQSTRWQLLKLIALAVAALVLLYFIIKLIIFIRRKKHNKNRLKQFQQVVTEIEQLLDPPAKIGIPPERDKNKSKEVQPLSFTRQCVALGEQIDHHTNRHINSKLVALLSYKIAKATKMSKEQTAICFCCALVADAGMLDLPRPLFFREYLSSKEQKQLRTQVLRFTGYLGFIPAAYMEFFMGTCLYRRENYDGSGYPEGLRESAIPVQARIIRVAEDYTAMTEWRLYGHVNPFSPKTALKELKKSKGLYDQRIVRIIEKLL